MFCIISCVSISQLQNCSNADDSEDGAMVTALIIVATESSGKVNKSEFVILNSTTADSVRWTATVRTGHDTKISEMRYAGKPLADVFDHVESHRDKKNEKEMVSSRSYSIVLIEPGRVKVCSVLDTHQIVEMRRQELLGEVFREILQHGPYGKANPMMYVLSDYVPTAVVPLKHAIDNLDDNSPKSGTRESQR
jgi:hypothetical protein